MKAKIKSSKKLSHTIAGHVKRGVKLVLIPHDKNDFRPHLVRRYGLMAIFFVAIGLQLGYNGATTGDILGRQTDITITSLLNQTNLERAKVNEPALQLNSKLNQAAYLKVQDMFDNQYWAHDSPSGTQPWKWFGDVGYNYSEAGENLAKNFSTTTSLIAAWMNSPEHKKNILRKEYEDVGFGVMDGVMNGKTTSIVVALYGRSAESAVAGTQTTFIGVGRVNDVWSQFAIAFQSLTPAAIGSLALIGVAIIVAILAHTYRKKLPKKLRLSWYRHHGLYKIAGLLSFGVILILMYGGGQI